MLTEWASGKGLSRTIPRWMRWEGWPVVAFTLTTIYGQMVSVYQYPKAVLVILGGSTVAAIAVGLVYGQEKRVWCKCLCPVNGVFGLLAKLAPVQWPPGAVALNARSPNHEVVGHRLATGWQTVLILFGVLGIAIGAFQWMANPYFIPVK